MYKISSSIISILVSVLQVHAQSLLLNGGFEEENICTEYKVDCAPEAWISNTNGFNNYFKDPNRAHSGKFSLAIEAGHSTKPFYRTFVRSRLLCGLRPPQEYVVELFIKSPHSILDSIGILFTSYDFLFDKRKLQAIAPTSFLTPVSGEFAKDSSWQKVSARFIAKGDEAFITIANFSRRDITGNTNIHLVKNFYVFLDDVNMYSLNPGETICDDYEITREDIYNQDERHHFLQRLIKQYRNDPPVVKTSPMKFRKVDTLILADFVFATNKSTLQPGSQHWLKDLCISLEGKMVDSIIVEGHTDNTGTRAFNEKLSMDRANTIANEIRSCMPVFSIPVVTRGFADQRPVSDNNSPEGKQRNRRVEVLVYVRG